MTEERFTINAAYSKSLPKLIGVICDNGEDMYMTDVVGLLNNLLNENEKIKQVLNMYLDNSYKELNNFKNLKNPSNPKRVRKQIIIRDAEIMLLIRILKEIDSSESVNTFTNKNEQLKQQREELFIHERDTKNELREIQKENKELKALLKAYQKSVEDYKYQIRKAVDEKLSVVELADNCGVDVE